MGIFGKKKNGKGVAEDEDIIIGDIDSFDFKEAKSSEYDAYEEKVEETLEEDEEDYEEDLEDSGSADLSDRDDLGSDDYEESEEELEDVDDEFDDEYEDDDYEDDELTQEEKTLKKQKRKKTALKVLGTIFGVILVVYLGISAFFWNHFYYNTTINGWNGSLKSVSAVEDHLKSEVQGYVLTLQENGGTTEQISGSDIDLKYEKDDTVSVLVKKQNPLLWPMAFYEKPEVEAKVGVSFDETKLDTLMAGLSCMDESKQTPPENAKPEFNGTQFVVKEEVLGSKIDNDNFKKQVRTALNGFVDTLNMEETGCYALPSYTKDSPEVQTACDTMNNYLKAKVTLNFSPDTVVVDASVISQWLTVNKKMEAQFSKSKVKAYVKELAKKYDTVGTKRKFTTASGGTATVSGGTYGWELDQDGEYKKLVKEIKEGKVESRDPKWSQKGATNGTPDWGTTYAEIDLTKQHMWYVKDGKVKFDAKVVTGLPTPEKETPTGVYDCLERMQNKTLRGAKQSDGSYEYETPVAYWMRITWTGVGFHTATWQPYFGGSLYKTNGSHGCVNMSYSDSQTLYGIIQVGDPVIIHK